MLFCTLPVQSMTASRAANSIPFQSSVVRAAFRQAMTQEPHLAESCNQPSLTSSHLKPSPHKTYVTQRPQPQHNFYHVSQVGLFLNASLIQRSPLAAAAFPWEIEFQYN